MFFWGVVLVQVQLFGTGTRCVIDILHKSGKMVKTKSQTVLGTSSYFVEVTGEKLVGGHFCPTYIYFSSIRFTSYGILYLMGNAWLFPSISNSTGNAAKSILWVLRLFFHSVIVSTFSKIWWFLKRTNRKTDKVNSFFKLRKINSRLAGIQSKIYQKKKKREI